MLRSEVQVLLAPQHDLHLGSPSGSPKSVNAASIKASGCVNDVEPPSVGGFAGCDRLIPHLYGQILADFNKVARELARNRLVVVVADREFVRYIERSGRGLLPLRIGDAKQIKSSSIAGLSHTAQRTAGSHGTWADLSTTLIWARLVGGCVSQERLDAPSPLDDVLHHLGITDRDENEHRDRSLIKIAPKQREPLELVDECLLHDLLEIVQPTADGIRRATPSTCHSE